MATIQSMLWELRDAARQDMADAMKLWHDEKTAEALNKALCKHENAAGKATAYTVALSLLGTIPRQTWKPMATKADMDHARRLLGW
jgi:hypothetical protein